MWGGRQLQQSHPLCLGTIYLRYHCGKSLAMTYAVVEIKLNLGSFEFVIRTLFIKSLSCCLQPIQIPLARFATVRLITYTESGLKRFFTI